MLLTRIFTLRMALLVFGFAVIAALPSCQDDPELVPIEDGIPEITPKSKVYITQIQLNSYPATDPNGDSWDTVDSATFDYYGLPDVFFNIPVPTPQPSVLWSQNSHFANVSQLDTVPFVLLEPYEVIPFGSDIDVNVYDYELPDSTLMTTASFFIGQYPNPLQPYPEYITSNLNGYSVTIWIKWGE